MGLPIAILPLKQLETFAEIFQEQSQPQTKTADSSKVLRRLCLLLVTYMILSSLWKHPVLAAATQENVLHSRKQEV